MRCLALRVVGAPFVMGEGRREECGGHRVPDSSARAPRGRGSDDQAPTWDKVDLVLGRVKVVLVSGAETGGTR